MQLGKPDKAIEYLTEPAEHDPEYAVTYNNLGIAYLAMNDFQYAEAQYKLAIEKDDQ